MQDNLISALDAAVTFARAGIAAIPEDISVDDECAAIDAMSASANSLAALILAGSYDRSARVKAEAWLDGKLN